MNLKSKLLLFYDLSKEKELLGKRLQKLKEHFPKLDYAVPFDVNLLELNVNYYLLVEDYASMIKSLPSQLLAVQEALIKILEAIGLPEKSPICVEFSNTELIFFWYVGKEMFYEIRQPSA